jgi:hypothetical protein
MTFFSFANSISISFSTVVRALQPTEKVIFYNDLLQNSSLPHVLNRVLLFEISYNEVNRSTDKRYFIVFSL